MPSSSLSAGQSLELSIDSIAFGGDGIARHDGLVVFVPFTAPGDKILAEVTQVKSGYARAAVRTILSPGPDRQAPPCPYYETCGGCQYQHLSYEQELRIKEQQIRDSFKRVAKMPEIPLLPIIASPQPYGYRNRITVHAQKGKIGFRGVDPARLIDIEKCLLASDEVNDRLTELRQSRPRSGHYSLRQSNLPPSGFFQANDLLLTRFQELGAQLFSSDMRFAVDAYSGAGFFTTKLLERFESVTAIEKDPRLVKDLNRLASPSLAVVEGDVAVTLAPVLEKLDLSRTALLLDPPREGLAPPVLQHILSYPPAELVYVSCDPAALARDSKTLAEKFQLRSVQPVDLFPRTAQIECVTCWVKR